MQLGALEIIASGVMNSSSQLSYDEARRRLYLHKRAADAIAEEHCLTPDAVFHLSKFWWNLWDEHTRAYLQLKGDLNRGVYRP